MFNTKDGFIMRAEISSFIPIKVTIRINIILYRRLYIIINNSGTTMRTQIVIRAKCFGNFDCGAKVTFVSFV